MIDENFLFIANVKPNMYKLKIETLSKGQLDLLSNAIKNEVYINSSSISIQIPDKILELKIFKKSSNLHLDLKDQ